MRSNWRDIHTKLLILEIYVQVLHWQIPMPLCRLCMWSYSKKEFLVILGGSQDITFAQYVAYQKLEETVNIVSVDSRFDLGSSEEPNNSDSYLGKLCCMNPTSCSTSATSGIKPILLVMSKLTLMEKLYFDAYRLGQVRGYGRSRTDRMKRGYIIVRYHCYSPE